MAKVNAPKPAAEPAADARPPDEILAAAAKHLHRPHGPLRDVKVNGPHVTGTNAKGQLVVTHADVAAAHARKLDALDVAAADDDDDQADAPADAPAA